MEKVISRRERKKLATRSALVAAAKRLFLANGYEKTTLEDICNEVDIHVTTFFGYFQSKEELAFADTLDNLENFRTKLAEKPADLGTLECFWTFLEQHGLRMREEEIASMIAFDQIPALRSRFANIVRQYEDAIAEALAIEAGLDPAADIYSHVKAATLMAVHVTGARWRRLASGTRARAIADTRLAKQIMSAFPSREDLAPLLDNPPGPARRRPRKS